MLATDQRITDKDDDGKTEVKTFSNVTLEVTPRIAEKIAVAQSMGTLSLSLRSIADNTAELERAVASGDVKVPANADPAQERQMLLAIANRPIDTNTTFTTGGDVSRFQRRTVPAARPSAQTVAGHGRPRQGHRPGNCGGPAPRRFRPDRSFASLAAIKSPSFRWELAKMKTRNITRRARLGTALAALAIGARHGRAPPPRLSPSRTPPGRRRR